MTSEMQPEVTKEVESPDGKFPQPPSTSKEPMLLLLSWMVVSSTTSKVEPEVNVPTWTPAVGELKPEVKVPTRTPAVGELKPEVNVPAWTPAVGELEPEVNVPARTPAVGVHKLAVRPEWLPTVVMSPVGMLSPERVCSEGGNLKQDDSPSKSIARRVPLVLASISRASLRALLSNGGGRPSGAVQYSAPLEENLFSSPISFKLLGVASSSVFL